MFYGKLRHSLLCRSVVPEKAIYALLGARSEMPDPPWNAMMKSRGKEQPDGNV